MTDKPTSSWILQQAMSGKRTGRVPCIPGISSVIIFSAVAALNASTTAGMVSAGGLGNVAIRYGYNNFNDAIMYSTVAIMVVLVQIIQLIGNSIYKKLK